MIRELHSDKTEECEFKLEYLWPAYYVRLTYLKIGYAPHSVDIPERVFEAMIKAWVKRVSPDPDSGGTA